MEKIKTLQTLGKKENIDLLLLLFKTQRLRTSEIIDWLCQEHLLSPGTVYRRIKELTRVGILKRYSISHKHVEYGIGRKERQLIWTILKNMGLVRVEKRNGRLIERLKGTRIDYQQPYHV